MILLVLFKRLVSVLAAFEDHDCCKSDSSMCFVFLLCGTNHKPLPVPHVVVSGSGLFHRNLNNKKYALCLKRMMLCISPLYMHCAHPHYPYPPLYPLLYLSTVPTVPLHLPTIPFHRTNHIPPPYPPYPDTVPTVPFHRTHRTHPPYLLHPSTVPTVPLHCAHRTPPPYPPHTPHRTPYPTHRTP